MPEPATFAAVAATLHAAHQVADHVFGQTDRQAAGKGHAGWAGWRHIVAHVGAYHAVAAAMLGVAVAVLDLSVTAVGVAAGIGFSAATHAVLDRRWPVRWLLERTGSGSFSRLASGGMCGMYLADQALHYGCLWVAALLIAAI